jgi:thiaminase/transcriptional activator TenA
MDASLYDRLKGACAEEWRTYTRHEFVRALGAGDLPEACFRHYLVQDYLFLIQFARAYALSVYKADTIDDMRAAARTLGGILDGEIGLHMEFCAEWGLSGEDLEGAPEATATIAYTRFVLERGMAGDVLDLHTALAPCVIGYGEIARALFDDPATQLEGNPYRAWIDAYAGEDYQALANAARQQLDALARRRLSEARVPALISTFRRATRLEAQFWQMGLDQSA